MDARYCMSFLLSYFCLSNSFLYIQLKEVLPDQFEVVSQYADVLPGGGFSPAYPFGGFVINFNVCTNIHRDNHDKSICIVMALSDDNCEGGDLCFLETGIRLELCNGDMVIFPSAKFSHYNMHFKGERASLVLHSDSSGDNWVENRNNWDHSIYMNVETNIN